MIYEYDFFDSNQLKQILSLFNSGKFVDGARTGNKSKFVKDNTCLLYTSDAADDP